MSINGFIYLDYLLNELSGGDAAASNGPLVHRPTRPIRSTYTDGTTAPNQVDLIYSVSTTIAASATATYDLGTGGGLTDRYGNALVFAEVVAILLVNRSTTATDGLRIGPHTVNGLTGPWVDSSDLNAVAPGASAAKPGIFYIEGPDGYPVGDGSTDTIRIVENGGANTVSYDLMILGRSA